MWNKEPKTIIDIINQFPTEQSCIEHLELIRWNGNVVSPFDASSKVYKTKVGYQCKNTGKNFNVKTNTIYEGSRISLCKWFCAVFMMGKEPKMSSVKLSEWLGLTQRTSWYMMKRVREANLWLNEKEVSKNQIENINNLLKSKQIKTIL